MRLPNPGCAPGCSQKQKWPCRGLKSKVMGNNDQSTSPLTLLGDGSWKHSPSPLQNSMWRTNSYARHLCKTSSDVRYPAPVTYDRIIGDGRYVTSVTCIWQRYLTIIGEATFLIPVWGGETACACGLHGGIWLVGWGASCGRLLAGAGGIDALETLSNWVRAQPVALSSSHQQIGRISRNDI